jgi:hypothetical protein
MRDNMTDLQAIIIAAGIAAAGLLNGGLWEPNNDSQDVINRFTGEALTLVEARRR